MPSGLHFRHFVTPLTGQVALESLFLLHFNNCDCFVFFSSHIGISKINRNPCQKLTTTAPSHRPPMLGRLHTLPGYDSHPLLHVWHIHSYTRFQDSSSPKWCLLFPFWASMKRSNKRRTPSKAQFHFSGFLSLRKGSWHLGEIKREWLENTFISADLRWQKCNLFC